MLRLTTLAAFSSLTFLFFLACSETVSGTRGASEGGAGGDAQASSGGDGVGGAASGGESSGMPTCGDGEVNQTTEQCDDRGASPNCTDQCRVSSCGDGVVNPAAGEVCDDGENNGAFDGCDRSCLFECVRSCPVRVDLAQGSDQADGSTWNDALKTIDAAIDLQASASGGDVWVKQGETGAVTMQPGVRLFGGFDGDESSLEQRPAGERTTLDRKGARGSVVVAARNSTLDGFLITGGNADKEGALEEVDGGGMLAISATNLRIENCDFVENHANEEGGAIYIDGGSVTIDSCRFEGNGAQHGGALFITNAASVSVTSSTFDANYLIDWDAGGRPVGNGGAVYADGTDPSFEDCVFARNQNFDPDGDFAFGEGAAVYSNAGAAPRFVNADFVANAYGLGNSVCRHDDSSAEYVSCTFFGHVGTPASSIIFDGGTTGSTITNCTFAENSPTMVTGHSGTTLSNSVLYQPDFNSGPPVSGAVVRSANCEEVGEGMLGATLDVLILPYPDTDGDGIVETYLNQTVANPCQMVTGDDTSAANAGLPWKQMTTAESGCKDVSPVDLGRHYPTEDAAPECL